MIIILVLLIIHTYNLNNTFWCPDVEYKDVIEICKKENLTDEDYLEIFNQTGISPYAIKRIIEDGRLNRLQQLNKYYLTKPNIKQSYLWFPFTMMDYTVS